MRYWRRRLQEDTGHGADGSGTRLVAITVCEDRASSLSSGLSVVAGDGVRIEVACGFDGATLERLLVSLRGLG